MVTVLIRGTLYWLKDTQNHLDPDSFQGKLNCDRVKFSEKMIEFRVQFRGLIILKGKKWRKFRESNEDDDKSQSIVVHSGNGLAAL